MKLSRNLSGRNLVKKLRKFGYQDTRQKGSHIRLETNQNGKHKITVPDHGCISKGTLSNILSSVATHLNIDKKELIKRLGLKK